MVDAPPDTPPPMALRAGELLRRRCVPYEDPDPSPRESGVFPVSVRAATHLAAAVASISVVASGPDADDDAPVSAPPMSLAPSNLARVLAALRAQT